MDAVTYPTERVIEFVARSVIPLRVSFNHPQLASRFNVKWTPTLVTVDSDGVEHHRTVGYLGPEEFIASQLIGMAKTLIDVEDFGDAIARLNSLIDDFPKSDFTPEAIYTRGVAMYKNTHDPVHLRKAFDKLSAEFPDNEWTKRAFPYRLIQ
jgi:TolA-binding protein